MGFCPNCGKELRDDELFCSECGNAVNAASQQTIQGQQPIYGQQPYSPQQVPQAQYPAVSAEKKGLAVCALVFSFLMPIVGIILGIIGAVKYKTPKFKNQCIAAIPISIVVWIINIVFVMNMF